MKKLWKVLVMLAVLVAGGAALTGWHLQRQIGREAMRGACSVGVIGAADGPTSIIITQDGCRGVVNAFFRLAFFFANGFSSLSGIRIIRHKKRRVRRRAERQ